MLPVGALRLEFLPDVHVVGALGGRAQESTSIRKLSSVDASHPGSEPSRIVKIADSMNVHFDQPHRFQAGSIVGAFLSVIS
jgi:hypothetical protein